MDACRAILRWDARGSRAGHLHGNALSKRSVIITVNKSVETRVTISVKDGTDKHVKSVSNKDVDLTGAMEDPRFQIKVLEAAIATIKGEMQQTTLPVDEKKTEVKTGSKEAKDAAKKVNEAKK
jgi:hypothetical protein